MFLTTWTMMPIILGFLLFFMNHWCHGMKHDAPSAYVGYYRSTRVTLPTRTA